MANLTGVVKQLRKEHDRLERQYFALNAALAAFGKTYAGTNRTHKRRKMSAKARARIAAAQRARWAKIRAKKKT